MLLNLKLLTHFKRLVYKKLQGAVEGILPPHNEKILSNSDQLKLREEESFTLLLRLKKIWSK